MFARFISLLHLLVATAVFGWTGDFESALERARAAAESRQYELVIEILTPYNSDDNPETEYVVAAEIGRAHFHLGRYDAAYQAFRTAVRIHPERVETAIFLESAAYLVGDTAQAFAIFRELLASGARDLYLAVTLPGARRFLAETEVAEILLEHAIPLQVNIARGSVSNIRFENTRAQVAEALDAPLGDGTSRSMTAQAGPAVIWEFIFDDGNRLVEIFLQVEHLELYTPYRLVIGQPGEPQTTPAALIAVLGSPDRTEERADDSIVMEWSFEGHRAFAIFGRPEIRLGSTPKGAAILRTLNLRADPSRPPDTMVR